jgi:outer membrane protein assembly factor BamB
MMNKKIVLALVILMATSSFTILVFKPANALTSSDDWPMLRADPSHTGAVTGGTLITPNLLWSYPTSNRPGASENSPAISNGILYVGSVDGNLYALDATSGTKLWNYSTGNTIDSSPAVYNGIVYVGALGFYALNATNGEKIWNSSSDYIMSSPTIVNGVVYFAGSHTVYALNAENGMMLWNNSVSSSNWQIVSSPAVANGIVYIGSDDHNLYALNATDGSQLWVYPTSSYVESSPTVANGIAYVISDDENLYALNTTNGEKLWSYSGTYDTANGESVAVVNNVVYVLSGNNGPHIFGVFLKALNAKTGVQLWSSNTTDCEPFPIVVGDVLYVDGINNLFAFNAIDGSWLWNSTQTGEILSSPAYANGVVYVDSINGTIYAFGTPSAPSTQATSSPTPNVPAQPTSSPTPNVPAQPTSSPTPNVPEFPAFAILPLLLSLFSIALVLRHRKKLGYQ